MDPDTTEVYPSQISSMMSSSQPDIVETRAIQLVEHLQKHKKRIQPASKCSPRVNGVAPTNSPNTKEISGALPRLPWVNYLMHSCPGLNLVILKLRFAPKLRENEDAAGK